MNIIPELYPMVALGETEGVAALLGGAVYTDEDVVRQVIPFGEALRIVSPVVSHHFLLDVKEANEAKDPTGAQLPKRDIYELVKREASAERLKKMASALRTSNLTPAVFRHSREDILRAIRGVLTTQPERLAEIFRAIEEKRLYFGPHYAKEMAMLDIDQVSSLIDILFQEIEPLKKKVDESGIASLDIDAILSLQNARNLAIVLADRAYEFAEHDFEKGVVTTLTERLRALAILEKWLDENAFKA